MNEQWNKKEIDKGDKVMTRNNQMYCCLLFIAGSALPRTRSACLLNLWRACWAGAVSAAHIRCSKTGLLVEICGRVVSRQTAIGREARDARVVRRARNLAISAGHRRAVAANARLGSGTTRPTVLIVLNASALPATLAFTTSGSTQCVELGVELSLGLDKRTAVVAHGLVSGVGVLGEDGECRSDKNGDQKNKGEDGVEDEEEDTHDSIDQTRQGEDAGEEEQEDGVEEVEEADENVENVGLLVHVGCEDADDDEEDGLDDEEGDSLKGAATLAKSDKHTLEEEVTQDGNNEVVCSGLELDVEETPLVKRNWIRVEDVGGILVHRHGTTGKTNDLG